MLKPPSRYLLLCVCILLVTGVARASVIGDYRAALEQRLQLPNPGDDPENTDENSKADTTKKKKREKRPLESYLFDDSTRAQKNFSWNVDMSANKVNMTKIDTLINDFQIDFPFLRKGVGDAYIGQIGGASIPHDYHNRPQFQDFSFSSPYHAYIYTVDNAPFFNVKKPFTRLEYHTAGQRARAEEIVSVTHAQNITPSLGFSLTFQTWEAKGTYTNQRTRDTDFAAGFYYAGKRYSAHAGYIFNNIKLQENGGLQVDADLDDPSINLPANYSVRLRDAKNHLRNNTFYAVQSYGIPFVRVRDEDFTIADMPAVFFGHSIEYSRWSKQYTDTKSGSQFSDGVSTVNYYDDWYINPTQSRDSLFESKLSNKLFVQLQPWNRDGIIGTVDAGVGMDNFQYYNFNLNDYITGGGNVKRTAYYVYGSVDGKFRKYFDWDGKLRFIPSGYRGGDIDAEVNAKFSAFIKKRPLSLSGKFTYKRSEAPYWTENMFSNHFQWNNSFQKENESRFEVRLDIPHINAEAVFYQSILNNKIYYGANCLPEQYLSTVSVTGLYLRKDFKIGILHLNHRALIQWSTNQEVVPVPLASVYLSYFVQFDVVRNVLRLNIGVDGRYNTKYYGYGYNPAIGQFYNQRETQIGGYPIFDVFVTAKWKRMRIKLKYTHVNDGLYTNNWQSFQVLHYPLNKPVFKMAISWNFYD